MNNANFLKHSPVTFFLIEVELIYNTILVSSIQPSDLS